VASSGAKPISSKLQVVRLKKVIDVHALSLCEHMFDTGVSVAEGLEAATAAERTGDAKVCSAAVVGTT
jgi:hypothetical protein